MLKKVVNKFIKYLEISNFERGGLFALLFCVLSVSGYYYYANSKVNSSSGVTLDEEQLALFRAELDSAFASSKDSRNYVPSKKPKEESIAPSLAVFNPNHDDLNKLLQKGVPPRVAHTITNFKSKGGSFQYKQDLKKLYVVSDEIYKDLEPYIGLPNSIERQSEEKTITEPSKSFDKVPKITSKLEINSATKEDLVKLKGIGDYYADKILEYREKLGGFSSSSQLSEVYNMREESAQQISDQIVIDSYGIKKIDINKVTFKQLLKHPYFSYNEVKAIVAYREQHGSIKTIEELEGLHIFRGKDVSRLRPYLDLN